MGAEQEVDVAEGQPVEDFLARAAALAAGEDGDANAGSLRQGCDGFQVLAGEDFGRRHEGGLAPGLDHGGGGNQRHHGFAGTDVALQQPQHTLRQRQIVDDLVDRALLRVGERIGQRLEDTRAHAAFAGGAASRLATHMRAHQSERQLAGKQFVEGEARRGQIFGKHVVRFRRPVQMA